MKIKRGKFLIGIVAVLILALVLVTIFTNNQASTGEAIIKYDGEDFTVWKQDID